MSVVVSGLTKIYGSQSAVNDISFEARPGEILGFLGPNGAGKSTTMKIATCFIPPTSGTVSVAGYDVTHNSLKVRKSVGYLPEHNPLYLDMYVHEYLQFIGSLHGICGKALKDRVCEMVGLCGLSMEQNKKIGMLSKGYRQRVGLAQALIHNPQVLILDEPTTGLDPNQILEIRNLIRNIGKEKTVIFSTHIMQEVEAICDKVVIINKGTIVANDKVSNLQNILGKTRVLWIEFDIDVEVEKLKAISGVLDVKVASFGKYEITTDSAFDVRSELFKIATKNNWTLLGLKQEERSLESIFQELTKKK